MVSRYSLAVLALLAAAASAQNVVPNLPPLPTDLAARSIKNPPRLQLGVLEDPSEETDQVLVIWQTVSDSGAPGSADEFKVEARLADDEEAEWVTSNPITVYRANTLPYPDTSDVDPVTVVSRQMHEAIIPSLEFHTKYTYRWTHLRDGEVLEVQERTFKTRVKPGDSTPFSFVQNADSSGDLASGSGFRAVGQLNKILGDNEEVDFSVANGDNAYLEGFHSQYDKRLSPEFSPEHADFMSRYIEFHSIGNHDIYNSAVGVRDIYAPPTPAIQDPLGLSEHYYSYDWGLAHFTVFDGNSMGGATGGAFFNNPVQFASSLEWIRADVAATEQPWKILLSHFPIGGSPDKPDGPDADYWKEIVQLAADLGVDLIMGGHSHTYSRSYPLVPSGGNNAKWVKEGEEGVTRESYPKGTGLTQVVAGNGGFDLRTGTWDDSDTGAAGGWVAAAFSSETEPACEFGVAKVDVSERRLRVSYLRATDGAAVDTFEIFNPDVEPAATDALPVRQPSQCRTAAGCDANARCVETSVGSEICQCLPGFLGNGVSCEREVIIETTTTATTLLRSFKAHKLMTHKGRALMAEAVSAALDEVHVEAPAAGIRVGGISQVGATDVAVTLTFKTSPIDAWDVREALKRPENHQRIASQLSARGVVVAAATPYGAKPSSSDRELAEGETYGGQRVVNYSADTPAPSAHRSGARSAGVATGVYVGAGAGVAVVLAGAAAIVAVKNQRDAKQAQEAVDRMAQVSA